jgi:hypothetical protein
LLRAEKSRRALLLLLLFASALVCAACFLGHGQSAAVAGGCAEQIRTIGVRGSGEIDNRGFGETVGAFSRQLEALGNPGVVESEGLDYSAVAAVPSKPTLAFGIARGPGTTAVMVGKKALEYRNSVHEGIDNLVHVVKQRASGCPDVKLVLAGYSQGAQVVREALPRLTSVASHIGGVALFGDPGFDPHSRAAEGTYSKKSHGLLGLPPHDFPAAFPHVVSYCRDGDLVCQGPPNLIAAHMHYHPKNTDQAARMVADWLSLRRTRTCAPAHSVATILDDSGSMEENDPLNIRAAAMQLLITEPGGEDRTLGAVEFGSEAGPLFAPGVISSAKGGMLAALAGLGDDGYQGTGANTDYNAAFAASAAAQSGSDARIFLTDGQPTVEYENGHQGGPRTYVIGLNIGPAGHGEEAADLLGRIAAETGGKYYPLRLHEDDDPPVQIQRLQPVFNSINTELECQIAPSQAVRSLTKAGAPAKPVKGSFLGNVGEQIVISWTTPGTAVGVAGISVRNANGGVVANLSGKGPKKKGKPSRKVEQLQTNSVAGGTFRTITVARPKHGSTISVRIVAEQLPEPAQVTVQLSPVDSLPSAAPATTAVPPATPAPPQPATPSIPASPPPPPPPPPPANHLEQETPNHPVNTFQNYHNASGMGPQIAAGQWVEVSCRVYDPTIASVNPDGYWYRIASSPWNNAYYAPANTFMNGDPYGGPYTHNTDFSVPLC